jgi:hypothetical protein
MKLSRLIGGSTPDLQENTKKDIWRTSPDGNPIDESNLNHSRSLFDRIPTKTQILTGLGFTLVTAKVLHTDGKVDSLRDDMIEMQERQEAGEERQAATEKTVEEMKVRIESIENSRNTSIKPPNTLPLSNSYVIPPGIKNLNENDKNDTISGSQIAKITINSTSKPKFDKVLLNKLIIGFKSIYDNQGNSEHIRALAKIGIDTANSEGYTDAKAKICFGIMEGIANLKNESTLQNIIDVSLKGYNKSTPGFGGCASQWIVNVDALKSAFTQMINDKDMPQHIKDLAQIGTDTANSEGYPEERAKICYGIMEGIANLKNESALQNIIDVSLNGYNKSTHGFGGGCSSQWIVNVDALKSAFTQMLKDENSPEYVKFSAQMGIDTANGPGYSENRAKECYKIMKSIGKS